MKKSTKRFLRFVVSKIGTIEGLGRSETANWWWHSTLSLHEVMHDWKSPHVRTKKSAKFYGSIFQAAISVNTGVCYQQFIYYRCICIQLYMYVCTCIYIYVRMYVYVRICTYVRMYQYV